MTYGILGQIGLNIIATGEREGVVWGAERDAYLEAVAAAPHGQVPLTMHQRLWEHAMRSLDDPGFPIRVAESLDVRGFEVVGYLGLASADLREAIAQVMRYIRLVTDASTWNIEPSDASTTYWMTPSGPLPLSARIGTEVSLAFFLHFARVCTGADVVPTEVTLRHAPPPSLTDHRRFFRAPIVWSAARSAITLTHSALSMRVSSADPRLAAILREQAEARIAALPHSAETSAALQALIARSMPHGDLSLAEAAKLLATSPRTLRRQLEREGTSFREVVDSTRCSLATLLFREKRSIAEVAFMLGFSEPSAFHRSFKRWTGKTPQIYRDELALQTRVST